MKRSLSIASLAAALLASSSALAVTNEPNGTQVPRDSMNGEEQLYTLFQGLGEPIDWLADAGTQPATFSPLCDFTATFVLNEAGSHFGLAWYNATSSAPPDSDLHVIMPAGTAVGTTVTSTDIKNDAAYAGGLIGFALVGGQTHYSEQQWDPVCSGCTPAAPWIAAVIYASKVTPNAYYIAFEDGNMGANPGDFANDGDFNDDVFFLTGLTCAGGGQPCDTGLPGACAAGLTQCTAAGVTCAGIEHPAAKETCNGVDDDCNGVVDEGDDICPTGFVCDKGACVQRCGVGEFKCNGSLVCDADGFCVVPSCADVMCDAGEVCVEGTCKAPCDGITCPYPTVCRVGACVDACAGVTCDGGDVCDQGVCVPACNCSPCAPSLGCDQASGQCVDPACVGVSCDAGKHCVAGACAGNCQGAACPTGQKCDATLGCVDDGSSGATGSGGSSTSTSIFTGTGAGSATAHTTGAGAGSGSAAGAGGAFGDSGSTGDASGGCGCHAAGDDGAPIGALGVAALVALALPRRRRRALRAP